MATWEDSVGGSRAVLLYLSEIAELCSQHLESPQWALKHAAASSVAEVVTVIVATEANMNQTVAERLWPLLERALGGKTWEGKEAVVYAFGKYCEAAESYYTQHPEVASAITKVRPQFRPSSSSVPSLGLMRCSDSVTRSQKAEPGLPAAFHQGAWSGWVDAERRRYQCNGIRNFGSLTRQ